MLQFAVTNIFPLFNLKMIHIINTNFRAIANRDGDGDGELDLKMKVVGLFMCSE